MTDLASRLSDETVEMMEQVTSAEDFPARLVPLKFFIGLSPKDLVARVRELAKRSTDRLRLGKIKIIADGSIQGFSARMRWPGYYNGAPERALVYHPGATVRNLSSSVAGGGSGAHPYQWRSSR